VTFQQDQKLVSETFGFGFRRRSGDDVLPGTVQRDQRLVVVEPDVGSRIFFGIVVDDVVEFSCDRREIEFDV